MATEAPVKPRLRGVSHHMAFYVALAAGAALVAIATSRAVVAAGVYAATLALLFGVSAAYHRVDWAPGPRALMRRLDHAAIFLFIAGSYTPICLLALGPAGHGLLAAVWAGAALGVARAVWWPGAPKAIAAALYVALGWLVVLKLPAIAAALGPAAVVPLAAGGALYSVGAVVYALRRPDPAPAVFGYHEVFHALVIVACGLHFGVIARLVTSPPPLAALSGP